MLIEGLFHELNHVLKVTFKTNKPNLEKGEKTS
jgi:hypothetical protein